jgi:hypothetical protein
MQVRCASRLSVSQPFLSHRFCLLRWLLGLCLALPVVAGAPGHVRADDSITVNGITFSTNTNGCLGPLVGIYGETSLRNYILATAEDYCNFQLADGVDPYGAIDVEWADGGSGCGGVRWVADLNSANVGGETNFLGASGASSSSCKIEGVPVNASNLKDYPIAVIPVEAIAQCPNAAVVQHGSWNGGSRPCLGGAQSQGANACAFANRTFPAPDSYSCQQGELLWTGRSTDLGPFGGCARITPGNLNRSRGASDRVTYCFNLTGAFLDICRSANVNAATDAPTASDMVADVCGIPSR